MVGAMIERFEKKQAPPRVRMPWNGCCATSRLKAGAGAHKRQRLNFPTR
jgi:hypothetical protein